MWYWTMLQSTRLMHRMLSEVICPISMLVIISSWGQWSFYTHFPTNITVHTVLYSICTCILRITDYTFLFQSLNWLLTHSTYCLNRYSCDLNPVESVFMKLKTVLKIKWYQSLLEYDITIAIMQAMTEINSTDMFEFFKNVTDNYMGL